MYLFKTELREQLLDGRKINYLCEKIGISRYMLIKILKGKNTTKKTTAYCIVKACNKDAEIEEYFIRKEK